MTFGVPNDCAIVAAMTLSGKSRREVEGAAAEFGYVRGEGLPTWAILALVEKFGARGNVSVRRGATPRTIGGAATGLVFTRSHVMPMVRGRCSNINGEGDELVTFVWSNAH